MSVCLFASHPNISLNSVVLDTKDMLPAECNRIVQYMACFHAILAISDNASILPSFLCHGVTGSIAYLPKAQHKAWPELKPGMLNLHSTKDFK